MFFGSALLTAQSQAQVKVVYSFSSASGSIVTGANPADAPLYVNGVMYVTTGTSNNANNYCGTVSSFTHTASGWQSAVVYAFEGGTDGCYPYASLISDSSGNLYGTTSGGGSANCPQGCGTAFELVAQPNKTFSYVQLYAFAGGADGYQPAGGLLFASTGLYGTTTKGGSTNCIENTDTGCGTVYKLVNSGGIWTKRIIHIFRSGPDGLYPSETLTEDASGNLYGTTTGFLAQNGYMNYGTVFMLSPQGQGAWTETVLRKFGAPPDSGSPSGKLLLNGGLLYGQTSYGGQDDYGSVYCVATPASQQVCPESVLYSFTGSLDGAYPYGSLLFDSNGNIVGTASDGGLYSCGLIYSLTLSAGIWTSTALWSFDQVDGAMPQAGLLLVGKKYYGTTFYGGSCANSTQGCGVFYQFTP